MPKPERNALCPCGSGRKYKRCCYAADSRTAAASMEDLSAALPDDDRWYGYDDSMPADASPFDLPEQGLVCMVWQVGQADVEHMKEHGLSDFKAGSWAMSTGGHDETIVHGPFENMEAAFEYGRTDFGATRYRQAPAFEGFDE